MAPSQKQNDWGSAEAKRLDTTAHAALTASAGPQIPLPLLLSLGGRRQQRGAQPLPCKRSKHALQLRQLRLCLCRRGRQLA